jgi:hypothetical protein
MPGLDARPGLVLTALVVTWVAVALLVLMVAHLHTRLGRLERAGAARPAARPDDAPFAALLGRPMTDLTGGPAPRVLLVLSSSCRSCRRLLADLGEPDWTVPTALAWADGSPGTPVGRHVEVLPDGPRISSALGVRVTPFGLVAGDDGRIVWAGPVTGLPALAARARTGAPTSS